MRLTRALFLIGVAVGVAACGDATRPVEPALARASVPTHRLSWAPGHAPAFRVRADNLASTTTGNDGQGIAIQPSIIAGPMPSPASVSFWAYTTQSSSAEIDYLAADSSWQPYVVVTIPPGALLRRPDGSLFGLVDSVLVSVTVDTGQVYVDLEPTGLTFNPLVPATLKIWYGGANPDYNGDGVVNLADHLIERVLLSVWCQEGPLDPWSLVPSIQSLLNQSFTADLRHFSGYAVSW